jgi:hypothetical protein
MVRKAKMALILTKPFAAQPTTNSEVNDTSKQNAFPPEYEGYAGIFSTEQARLLLSDKSSHLRCWRLRSADQLPTRLVLSGAPGPHLQVQPANKLKLNKATYNDKGINKSKTNNISNTLIVLFKIVIILFRIF